MGRGSKIVLAIGAAGLLVIGGFFLTKRSASPSPTPEPAAQATATPAAKAAKAAAKPLALPASSATDKRPKECRELLNRIAAIDMSELGYIDSRTPPDKSRLAAFPRALRAMKLSNGCGKLPETDPLMFGIEDFMRVCAQIPEHLEDSQLEFARVCMDKLYALRLQAFADAYADVPASKLDDPALVALIMRGTPTMSSPSWPDRYLELARRRAELNPGTESTTALTQASYTSLLMHKEQAKAGQAAPLSPEEEKRLSDEILASADKLEQAEPGSVRAFETRLLMARMKGDVEEMKRLANDRIERGENVAEATYYLAQTAYLSGDKAKARKEVEKLLQQDPQNVRYQRALEGIDRAPAGTGLESIFGDRNTVFGLEEGDPFAEVAPH